MVLIGLFVFKILSKNSILTLIKGRNSVANLPKFELIQAFMHVLVTCRMEKIKLKMKVLDCSQDFSHNKSMGIFPGAQGQLTLQSRSDLVKFELVQDFMVVLLTCKNEDPIKNKALECSQHYTSIFQTCKGR